MTQFDTTDRERTLDSIEDELAFAIGSQISARRRRRRNRVAMSVCSVAAIAAIAVGVVNAVPGGASDPVTPAAAEVLEKAAKAASDGPFVPREISPGEYLYTNEIAVTRFTGSGHDGPYHFNVREDTEQWVGSDLSGLLRFNKPIGPVFLSQKDKQRWKDVGSPSLDNALYGGCCWSKPPVKVTREAIAPVGYFDEESARAVIYGQDVPDTSEELMDVYDVEDEDLVALSRNQRRFNNYTRKRVRRVTKQLSGSGVSRAKVTRRTDRATFALAFELLSQRATRSSKARAALLRLAATADDELQVDPNARTLLGKPGVAVTEVNEVITENEDGTEQSETSTETIIFDPVTFVVLEARVDDTPAYDTYPIAGAEVSRGTDYEYGIVNQLRTRPDGQQVAPSTTVEQLD